MKREIKVSNQSAYFAASNSRDGFCSYYEHCFRARVDQLFCIKGGPGTGKSTLMRRVAACAQHLGWQVEYYYCSSDADSLDAVLMFGEKGSVGLVDATAPHVFEPTMPGAREHILDLGRFWDAARLRERQGEIGEQNRIKGEAYRAAYRLLSGAGEVSDAIRQTVEGCLDVQRLDKCIKSVWKMVKGEEQTGGRQIRLSDSLGLRGRVRLDTYLRQCERLCLVEDHYDSAYAFMAGLAALAERQGQGVDVSYHPVLPDRVDALLFRESQTAFVVCESAEVAQLSEQFSPCRIIRMKRILQLQGKREVRQQLRRQTRLREALVDEAGRCLERAAKAHFVLESVYGQAMDFQAQQAFTRELCRELLGGNE